MIMVDNITNGGKSMKYFGSKAFRRDLIILVGLIAIKFLVLPMFAG